MGTAQSLKVGDDPLALETTGMGRLLGHMHSLPDDKFRRDAGSSWLLALGLVLILGFYRSVVDLVKMQLSHQMTAKSMSKNYQLQ
jgi:hypothetical protein